MIWPLVRPLGRLTLAAVYVINDTDNCGINGRAPTAKRRSRSTPLGHHEYRISDPGLRSIHGDDRRSHRSRLISSGGQRLGWPYKQQFGPFEFCALLGGDNGADHPTNAHPSAPPSKENGFV
jgi:hypothetical protein